MTSYCFVLDKKGNKLSPTKENKGWYLIRKKRAVLINKFPMVIQLFKSVSKEKIDQTPIHLGIDDGSKYVGIALVQKCATKNKPVFKGTIEQRQDVKHLMDVRRGYRKYKKYHKKYRARRFNNRSSSKRKGRIAPSIKQKREATLLRDKFTCMDCRKKECRLEAHHIIPRRLGGNDSIDNLITLCKTCHDNIHGIELNVSSKYQQLINGKNVNLKDAQHVMQGKNFLRAELSKMANVHLTTGCDTANKRIDRGIEKTHSNDAIVIANLEVNSSQCSLKDWTIKPMRRKSKAKTEEVNGFKHRDFVCYTKKNGEKYVGYITALYPDKKQCNLTTINGKVLKRYGLKSMKLLWRFNKIYWF